MTKNETSLLLFLETQAVDSKGIVKTIHMNDEDFEIGKRWDKDGFVKFGRRFFHEIEQIPEYLIKYRPAYYVVLSDKAWQVVARERRARAERHLPIQA